MIRILLSHNICNIQLQIILDTKQLLAVLSFPIQTYKINYVIKHNNTSKEEYIMYKHTYTRLS